MGSRLIMSLSFVSSLAIFLFFSAGGVVKHVNGQAPGQGSWCVPKPSASDEKLQEIIDFACGTIGEQECLVIKPGGLCFEPHTLINHASLAMNIYYQKMGRNCWNCDYKSSGIVTVTDPSYGGCKFLYA